MKPLGLEREVVDEAVYERSVKRFAEAGIRLPAFSQLAEPTTIPEKTRQALDGIGPDEPDPLNLFRVHWYNAGDRRGRAPVPVHLVLPPELTGVETKIVVALGTHFPLIRAHKVLAAYGCLVPRILTGQFDPTAHKALWPSTGNYCRGGVAISRILGCRGVAILPEGMSKERFNWLEKWVAEPGDIIRTPGTESNVKEIYDRCNELDRDPGHVIFNQFCEFGNYLVHYLCTGRALSDVFEHLRKETPGLRLRGFTSASGSAGTLAAGDFLKEQHGCKIAAVEALECPTLLYNGFGEHNIQGIGDKHVPLIHNVMNTDLVIGISDRATDGLDVLFNTDPGRSYLIERRGVAESLVKSLSALGFSGICNVLAAIKVARYYQMDENDVLLTVATDGSELYDTERELTLRRRFSDRFDSIHAAEVFGEHLSGQSIDHLQELSHQDRTRIFNLGYFTWVEQQGVSVEEFSRRKNQEFWRDLRELIPAWDAMIEGFNRQTGVPESPS